MQVVKYFFEEPASLEVLAPDLEPDGRAPSAPRSLEDFLGARRYYRGYLTASDLQSQRFGATAVPDPWLAAAGKVLPVGVVRSPRLGDLDAERALRQGITGDWLAAGPPDVPLPSLQGPVREVLGSLRPLLDAGLTVVLAEPAHDGVDWAFFSAEPMADRFREALRGSDAACYLIPHAKARGEHKFWFERYDLGLFAQYRV